MSRAKRTTEEFIKRCKEIHGNKYMTEIDELLKLKKYFEDNPQEGSIKFVPSTELIVAKEGEPQDYSINIEISTIDQLSELGKCLIENCDIKEFTCKI